MNIKILDSWLKEFLKTKATAPKIGEMLSLSSVSVERVEEYKTNDFLYDIEVTTNRPDLMSVVGLAREAGAILPEFNVAADFMPPLIKELKEKPKEKLSIQIKNDPSLVDRICAVIMEVNLKESPQYIKERLGAAGIRSLNNLIDVTNYVMREIGHPTHVFDYDRLKTKKLIIREAKKGEKVVTLDGKEYRLAGGDIVADNGEGEIVDLLGVMGTANSVVTDKTKRILFFLDNNKPHIIRRTSMGLAIRTEAAVLNEKGVDPELAMTALLRGIELFKETADGKLLSDIIDIYPNKPKTKHIKISQDKINDVIGVKIPIKKSGEILKKLGFETNIEPKNLLVTVPSWRNNDMEIEEDIVEEIARVYGYYKLPSLLPPLTYATPYHMSKNPFYIEKRIKEALKYWGFTETYSYSLVSEDLLEGPTKEALEVSNPLSQDLVYLRKTLVPSLLKVIRDNENKQIIKIFEMANVYMPKANDLPNEVLMLGGAIKKEKVSFYEIKGVIEQLLNDLGIKNMSFKQKDGGTGAQIYINKDFIGEIEILDENIADFELNFQKILNCVNLSKTYTPILKFPPVIEDISMILPKEVMFQEVVNVIKNQSDLIKEVNLFDTYENKKSFRIKYQDPQKTLTNEEVSKVREKVYQALEKELEAKVV
ncbi:phenylalanine--tRNA ligase subunit beta [Candidatus Microgenomates bacterium]|nr:MAG: phenylalanine--tRNA ligase subunit beta [Candidatus Microgenomates bacterium]